MDTLELTYVLNTRAEGLIDLIKNRDFEIIVMLNNNRDVNY